tara:strand:+ start:547 stop:678 length:132 start_codon:yes stop_codon:yes gene_type:complete
MLKITRLRSGRRADDRGDAFAAGAELFATVVRRVTLFFARETI